MTDLERLEAWMNQRGLNMKQMARDMDLDYINVYHTLVARPKRNKRTKVNGNFIVRFASTYGNEAAASIFSEFAPREVA